MCAVLRRLHLEAATLNIEGAEMLLFKGVGLGDHTPGRGRLECVGILHSRHNGVTFLDSRTHTGTENINHQGLHNPLNCIYVYCLYILFVCVCIVCVL